MKHGVKRVGAGAIVGAAMAATAGLTQQAKTANASTISPAVNTATVTYILSINDDGTGTYAANNYALYAVDNSSSSNLGIVNFSVNFTGFNNITGVDTPFLAAPVGSYDTVTGAGTHKTTTWYTVGFSVSNHLTANGFTGIQDTSDYRDGNGTGSNAAGGIILAYGVGQTAGSLTTIAASTLGASYKGESTQDQAPQTYGQTIGNYSNAVLLVQGDFSGSTPAFTSDTTYDTAEVFTDHTGNISGTPQVTIQLATDTLSGAPAHSALLTITAGGSASPAYIGTSKPVTTLNSSTITVVNTETGGYYVPGLLNSIAVGNAANGAVKITGFANNDKEIVAVALTVADGNGTHAPTTQELTDIIADLNLTVDQSLPAGVTAIVETFASLPSDAATLLSNTNSYDGGQTLELAVVLTGTGLTNPQTFGLNFTSETADGMTAVDVTDIAVVPEPASMSLLFLAGLPLLIRPRKKVDA